LISNDCTKRLSWPLGRVIEIFPGKDGVIRVVRLVTESGQLIRSIQKLYSLEVDCDAIPETLHTLLIQEQNQKGEFK